MDVDVCGTSDNQCKVNINVRILGCEDCKERLRISLITSFAISSVEPSVLTTTALPTSCPSLASLIVPC